MSEPMTREQVENELQALVWGGKSDKSRLLEHDARQREELQKEHARSNYHFDMAVHKDTEIDALKAELHDTARRRSETLAMCDQLQAELAAVTPENTAWTLHHDANDKALGLRGVESLSQSFFIEDLTQQLAAREARIKELEEALREIASCLVEINPNNYDEDDIVAQNGSVIASVHTAQQALTKARAGEG